MPWTAGLLRKRIYKGILVVDVRFTDGTDEVEETFQVRSGDNASFLRQVENKRKTFEDVDAFAATLTPGPIDTSSVQPVPPPAPDPAKQAWLEANEKLRRASQSSVDGGIDSADTELARLRNFVRINFLPEYLD